MNITGKVFDLASNNMSQSIGGDLCSIDTYNARLADIRRMTVKIQLSSFISFKRGVAEDIRYSLSRNEFSFDKMYSFDRAISYDEVEELKRDFKPLDLIVIFDREDNKKCYQYEIKYDLTIHK